MPLHILPAPLAHQAAVAYATFHNSMTPTAERNAVVTDLLQELRQHDPNLSVWDLLHVFDAMEGR